MPTRQPENMVFRITGRNINYSPILDLTYIYRRRKIDTSNMNEVPFRFSVRVWTSMHTREDIEGSMIQYIGLSLGSHSFICGSASQCSNIESPLSSSGRIRDCVTVDVLIEVGSSCAYPCILIIKVYHPVNRRDSAVIEIRLLSMSGSSTSEILKVSPVDGTCVRYSYNPKLYSFLKFSEMEFT
jgi:hypothetical protein